MTFKMTFKRMSSTSLKSFSVPWRTVTPPVCRRVEEMMVAKVRENRLSDSNIREPVRLVDEKMDGIVCG